MVYGYGQCWQWQGQEDLNEIKIRGQIMYLIAFCDDRAAELEKAEKLLGICRKEHSGMDILVKCCKSADELLNMVKEKEFFPVSDKPLNEMEEERKEYLLLWTDGRTRRVPVNEIVYCEAKGKEQYMYLADGTQLLLRMTMIKIYGMLASCQEFVRIGSAYVVNMECIVSLSSQDICLNTGEKIYLPRGAYKPLKERYCQYYCKEQR